VVAIVVEEVEAHKTLVVVLEAIIVLIGLPEALV
jgi:hypothetical protein